MSHPALDQRAGYVSLAHRQHLFHFQTNLWWLVWDLNGWLGVRKAALLSFAVSDQSGLLNLPEMAEVRTLLLLASSRPQWLVCDHGMHRLVSPLSLLAKCPLSWPRLAAGASGGPGAACVPLRSSATFSAPLCTAKQRTN